MTWYEKVRALIMLPMSRSHLSKTMQHLQHRSCDFLLQQIQPISKNNVSINVTVKSYFWAARTLKNCHCLPRSIALYQKLRASGYKVEHKFGIDKNFDSSKQDKSLAAHSWVEYNGLPLNESPDLKHRFKVLEKI